MICLCSIYTFSWYLVSMAVFIAVLCLGQYFWGTQVSLYLNFRVLFTNSRGHTKSFKFLPVKLNSYPETSVHFFFKFELNVDSFGSRKGVDDREVVSAIVLVFEFNSKFTFSILKIAFSGLFCYEIRVFHRCCCVLDWLRSQYQMWHLS